MTSMADSAEHDHRVMSPEEPLNVRDIDPEDQLDVIKDGYKVLREATKDLARDNRKLKHGTEHMKSELEGLKTVHAETMKAREEGRRLSQSMMDLQLAKEETKQIQDERTVISKEVQDLKAANALLEKSCNSLEHVVTELTKQVVSLEEQTAQVLEDAAQSRSRRDQRKDQQLREQFRLPTSEFVIASYSCAAKGLAKNGTIYISPSYVCFDTETSDKGSENKRVIPITDIARLSKAKFAYMLDNALQFQLKGGETWTLSNFFHRERCYQNILDQASRIGHGITT